MPRNTREWAKRKLDSAVQNINWAGTHLEEVIRTYKPTHNEVAEPLELVQTLLIHVIDLMDKVKRSF